MDAYVAWREACVRAQDAHRSWGTGHGPDAGQAFDQYAAALDKEERAADWYARVTRRVELIMAREGAAAKPAGPPSRQARSA
jgi:hypothetical protein